MLIEEFSFGNFRSFKDIQTLRMSAAKITSRNKDLDTQNVLTINEKTKLLKSKLIYGANASGKSNIILALSFFQTVIIQCLKYEDTLGYMENPFFYSTETKGSPCFFQMIFHIEGKKYRYGFEATTEKIHNEWLYMTHTVREIPVFIREDQNIVELSRTYMPKGYEISRLKTKLFTEKVLFLSLVESFGDKLGETILGGLGSILIYNNFIEREILEDIVTDYLKNSGQIDDVIDLVKYADTGIQGIKLAQRKKISENGFEQEKTIVRSVHSVYNENLEKISALEVTFSAIESEGTRQILSLSPYILPVLKSGEPVIIDEFGSQLHPLLTKKIFSLFNSDKNNKSQIIAATHTTELMSSDLLRKDQIDFVEKDIYGRSYLYTLVEIKGIRNTASFESDYFKGKYGAIPFLGNWGELEKICDETSES